MNEPMTGPATGPAKTAPAKTDVAMPRSMGSIKSTYMPPMMARGAEPNVPARKRQMKIVSRFCATATGIWKMQKTIMPAKRGRDLPKASDIGPQMSGPVMY